MAKKWLEKFTKIAQTVGENIQNTTENISKNGLGDIASKASNSISEFSEKTQEYFKDIGNTNKEIMNEVENKIKKNEDANVNPKVASYIAATINTTQTIANDIVNVGKKVINNVSNSTESNNDDESIVLIDAIPVESVLRDVLRAKNISPGSWKDEHTNQLYFIIGPQEWWAKETNNGGSGSISLMAHHLSILSKRDLKTYEKAFTVEAVGVLKNFFSEYPEKANDNDMDNPSIKTNKEKAEQLNPKDKTDEPIKKSAKKSTKVARKKSVKKVEDSNDEKTDKKVSSTKKTVRKTATKTATKKTPKA